MVSFGLFGIQVEDTPSNKPSGGRVSCQRVTAPSGTGCTARVVSNRRSLIPRVRGYEHEYEYEYEYECEYGGRGGAPGAVLLCCLSCTVSALDSVGPVF